MWASYRRGRTAALVKLGLAPTQTDSGIAATERGQDIPPDDVVPPMSHVPGAVPASTGSCSPPTPGGSGSTVGSPLAGDPAPETHPNISALSG
jgi:hypothetical protein